MLQPTLHDRRTGDSCTRPREDPPATATSVRPPTYRAHSWKIIVWNVQTLKDNEKGVKLSRKLDRYGVDVLGVAECRYTASSFIRIEDKVVVYFGRKDNFHYQGIVLFCSARAASCLVSLHDYYARFKTQRSKMSVVMRYASTEAASREEKYTFYSQLKSV